MKALSTSIVIVVTAVVILVAALVILTIFGGGMGTVGTLTSFRTQCITQCQITCKMNAMPPTWTMAVNVQGVGSRTCKDEVGVDSCTGVCGTGMTPTTGGTGNPTVAYCNSLGQKRCCDAVGCGCYSTTSNCPNGMTQG